MYSVAGLDADPVVDRVLKALFTPKISLGRLDGDVPQQELNLIQLASASRHRRPQVRRRSCGAKFAMTALLAQSLMTCHTNLSVTTVPQVFPAQQTHRKTRPPFTPAETSQESMAVLTQSERAPCECVGVCRSNRRWPDGPDLVEDGRPPIQRPPSAVGHSPGERREGPYLAPSYRGSVPSS